MKPIHIGINVDNETVTIVNRIHSKIKQEDGSDKTMLEISVQVPPNLMSQLIAKNRIGNIQVDAQIIHNGQRLNQNYCCRSVDILETTVTYDQELVSCDELTFSKEKVEKVDLVLETTFTTRPSETEIEVKKKEDVDGFTAL